MKRMVLLVAVLLVLGSAALCLTQAAPTPQAAHGGGLQCGDIVCHSGSTCCFTCTGDPLCVKPGVMCPVCPPL